MDDSLSNPAQMYAEVRDELITALHALDADAASQTVPACPAWSVKDVVSHLCGLTAEFIAETPGSLGSEEATTRQVADRSASDLSGVIREWLSLADDFAAKLATDEYMAKALVADLVMHAFDLHEVLDQPIEEATRATPMSAHRYVPLLQTRVADQLATALTVELTDGSVWPAPTDPALSSEVMLRTSPHSFLRGVAGRLRRSEVEAFDWSRDPSEILDQAWNQYGPFRV